VAQSPSAMPAIDGEDAASAAPVFTVAVGGFDGPFDLLLSLIGKHELDITEVSLSLVTTEFIAYLRTLDSHEEMNEASEFLVVAATLLDLKVAGLLPQGELVDAEDVALLEARDLLFARLLQYRAFKEAPSWFDEHLLAESTRTVRSVRLEEKFRQSDARARVDAVAGRFRGARRRRARAAGASVGRARPPARPAREHPGAGGARRHHAPPW
jgi:segregation and condensation protein A